MNNFLIKNVCVPGLDLDEAHIVIKDGRYDTIMPAVSNEALIFIQNWEKDNKKTVDGRGWTVLPTFTDIHTHLDKAFTYEQVPNYSGTLREAITNYQSALPSFTEEAMMERMRRLMDRAVSYGTGRMRTHINAGEDKAGNIALQAASKIKEEYRGILDLQIIAMVGNMSQPLTKNTELQDVLLSNNIDGIGGAPHLSESCHEEIEDLFAFASSRDLLVDLHADEQDDPEVRSISHIIKQVKKYDYQKKTTAGHLCSLSAMEEEAAFSIIDEMIQEQIYAVTLPAANLCLQGRDDKKNVRRGTTRVTSFLDKEAVIAAGSDNVNDPFHPFGDGDMLLTALIAAYANHLTSQKDISRLFQMITTKPAEIFGQTNHIQEGEKADFVLIEGKGEVELLSVQPGGRKMYRNGRWVSERQETVSVWKKGNIYA